MQQTDGGLVPLRRRQTARVVRTLTLRGIVREIAGWGCRDYHAPDKGWINLPGNASDWEGLENSAGDCVVYRDFVPINCHRTTQSGAVFVRKPEFERSKRIFFCKKSPLAGVEDVRGCERRNLGGDAEGSRGTGIFSDIMNSPQFSRNRRDFHTGIIPPVISPCRADRLRRFQQEANMLADDVDNQQDQTDSERLSRFLHQLARYS
ncbi:hypothetical protein CONLIGDRAFT_646610 [Coniochaeta ligniaria NRRL 30616]|uniref:Uncharacterized protein n=1 Tax=Coniochaeta ligniaria NRRL 30616 TaxID=1408157 RepID=A0A1J7J9H1_9PEZI|nr:hypothetical protein CONLIGDRAFT_646610 [Coniochaeta ligniaria NRRL 30616]